jgi:hypothetical protein
MNLRPAFTFRQFQSVDNFRSWLSYQWTAISLCTAHQVGEFRFDRRSGEGFALQSSTPRARRVRACRSMQRGHSGDLRRS